MEMFLLLYKNLQYKNKKKLWLLFTFCSALWGGNSKIEKSYFITNVEVDSKNKELLLTKEEKKKILQASNILPFTVLRIPICTDLFSRAIARVLAIGYQIKIKKKKIAGINIAIILEVYKIMPKIKHIKLEGIKKDKNLLDILNASIGKYYRGEITLKTLKKKVKKHLHSLGYTTVEVEAKWELDNDNSLEGNIILEVKKGPIFYTKKVEYEGITEEEINFIKEKILIDGEEKIKWKSFIYSLGKDIVKLELVRALYKIWSNLRGRQYFQYDLVDSSSMQIKQFFYTHGYLDVEVKPKVILNRDKGSVQVIFYIKKGKQYHIGKITFQGNESYTDEELSKYLEIKVGMVYTPGALHEKIYDPMSIGGISALYEKKDVMLIKQDFLIQGLKENNVNLLIRIREVVRPKIRKIQVAPGGIDSSIVENILASHKLIVGKKFHRSNLIGAENEMKSSHLIDSNRVEIKLIEISKEEIDLDCKVPIGERAINMGMSLDLKSGIDASFVLENLNLWKILNLKMPTKGIHALIMKLLYEWGNKSEGKPIIFEVGFENPFIFFRQHRFFLRSSYRYSYSLDRIKYPYQRSEAEIIFGNQYNLGAYRYRKLFEIIYGKGKLIQKNKEMPICRFHYKFILSKSSLNDWFYPTKGNKSTCTTSVIMPIPWRALSLRPIVRHERYHNYKNFVFFHNLGIGLNKENQTGFGHFFLGGKKESSTSIYLVQDAHHIPIRGYERQSFFDEPNKAQRGGNFYLHYTFELRYRFNPTTYIIGFFDLGSVAIVKNISIPSPKNFATIGIGLRKLISFIGIFSVELTLNMEGKWNMNYKFEKPESF